MSQENIKNHCQSQGHVPDPATTVLDRLRFVRLANVNVNVNANDTADNNSKNQIDDNAITIDNQSHDRIIWWPCLLYNNYKELLSSTTSNKQRAILSAERYRIHRHDVHYSVKSKVARILGMVNNNRRMQFVSRDGGHEESIIKDFIECEEEMEERFGDRKDWYDAFTAAHHILNSAIDGEESDDEMRLKIFTHDPELLLCHDEKGDQSSKVEGTVSESSCIHDLDMKPTESNTVDNHGTDEVQGHHSHCNGTLSVSSEPPTLGSRIQKEAPSIMKNIKPKPQHLHEGGQEVDSSSVGKSCSAEERTPQPTSAEGNEREAPVEKCQLQTMMVEENLESKCSSNPGQGKELCQPDKDNTSLTSSLPTSLPAPPRLQRNKLESDNYEDDEMNGVREKPSYSSCGDLNCDDKGDKNMENSRDESFRKVDVENQRDSDFIARCAMQGKSQDDEGVQVGMDGASACGRDAVSVSVSVSSPIQMNKSDTSSMDDNDMKKRLVTPDVNKILCDDLLVEEKADKVEGVVVKSNSSLADDISNAIRNDMPFDQVMKILQRQFGWVKIKGGASLNSRFYYYITSEHKLKTDLSQLRKSCKNNEDYFVGDDNVKTWLHKQFRWIGPPRTSRATRVGRSDDGIDIKGNKRRNGRAPASPLTPRKKVKVTVTKVMSPQSSKRRSNSIVEKPRKNILERDDFGTAWDVLHHSHGWERVPAGPIVSNSGYIYVHGKHSNDKISGAICLKHLNRAEDYFVEDEELKEYLHETYHWVGPEGKEFVPTSREVSEGTGRRRRTKRSEI